MMKYPSDIMALTVAPHDILLTAELTERKYTIYPIITIPVHAIRYGTYRRRFCLIPVMAILL